MTEEKPVQISRQLNGIDNVYTASDFISACDWFHMQLVAARGYIVFIHSKHSKFIDADCCSRSRVETSSDFRSPCWIFGTGVIVGADVTTIELVTFQMLVLAVEPL